MTTQDFNQMPLFSSVHLQLGSTAFDGYIIKKSEFTAVVYSPNQWTVITNVYPSMLTLLATYLPFQVPPPPYSFENIPIFSTVRDTFTNKIGILIDKNFGAIPEGHIYFTDDSFLWRNPGYIQFLELPPGNYYNPTTQPDTTPATTPVTYPSTLPYSYPNTTPITQTQETQTGIDKTSGSVLLVVGAILLFALAWS